MIKCKNTFLCQQCLTMKAAIENYKSGLIWASKKDDGKTDKEEAKLIKTLTKDLERLQKTLNKYDFI